ncbi:hypothetical protein TD95_004300 [Thielaviopsis punctulata]|uniref:Uncharacterized protein n=1 Tax=Thielaviopsis punctulata TaxID=72032 RepID=A0A0F4ZA75_9PEZI|nr:hypothetical protein TD95_004300 [Thielaviopsis punctulata]
MPPMQVSMSRGSVARAFDSSAPPSIFESFSPVSENSSLQDGRSILHEPTEKNDGQVSLVRVDGSSDESDRPDSAQVPTDDWGRSSARELREEIEHEEAWEVLDASNTQPVSPSCFLRAGSKYRGTQRAERQVYEVNVDIKHVDMNDSYMCGYLKIQGLTPDHPQLTTFFQGEIIGPKYSFFTNHESWGATEDIDLSHWSKFPAFRTYTRSMRKDRMPRLDHLPQEYVFMRWKEHFLVPDHTVRSISGASFEGFYYIAFNMIKAEIQGIYFHARSEK